MITVTGKQVREIEYLIHQSIQGHHVLFDPQAVKRILENRPPEPEKKRSDGSRQTASEKHLEGMLELPTLAQKRAFLEKLSPPELEGLIRVWFNVVENSLYQASHERH